MAQGGSAEGAALQRSGCDGEGARGAKRTCGSTVGDKAKGCFGDTVGGFARHSHRARPGLIVHTCPVQCLPRSWALTGL